MRKRRKSGRFARVKGRGIDRTELVKDFHGNWCIRRNTSAILNANADYWFVLPKNLKRLTLCVSKRSMPESYRMLYVSGYVTWNKNKWFVGRGLKRILSRMGGGVLYVAVEI